MTVSPWKEAITAARKGESGRENVNSRCRSSEAMGNARVRTQDTEEEPGRYPPPPCPRPARGEAAAGAGGPISTDIRSRIAKKEILSTSGATGCRQPRRRWRRPWLISRKQSPSPCPLLRIAAIESRANGRDPAGACQFTLAKSETFMAFRHYLYHL